MFNFKKVILIISIFFMFFSCLKNDGGIYKNKKYRYKIKCPNDWIQLEGKVKNNEHNDFIIKLKKEEWITNFAEEDVTFYNPESEGPIFESIRVHAKDSRIEVGKLRQYVSRIGESLSMKMGKDMGFVNVRNSLANIIKFKKGDIIRYEFSFGHKDESYEAFFFIIPGAFYGTYFISGTCKKEDRYKFLEIIEETVNSFSKF